MKIKDLISKLEELSQQYESGLDTHIFIVENWFSMNSIQQEVRDLYNSDLTIGKVNEFPVMKNLSNEVEGLIIGYLNKVV